MIGTYRYYYNQGINYLCGLPRGYYIPRKGEKVKANYIYYEDEYLRVETGGKYAFGILPVYDEKGKRMSQTGFQAIRNHLKKNQPEWFTCANLPVHLIDQASREVASNYKAILDARKIDRKPFRMNYKSKWKSTVETITMEASSMKKYRIYAGLYRRIDSKIRTKEPISFDLDKEYKLSYHRNTGDYYISVPVKSKRITKYNKKKYCSIDVGEVVPYAIYDPQDNNVLLVGENHRTVFEDTTISKLTRKISLSRSNREKNSYKKALQRTRNRNINKKQEMHHKLASYLCSNFEHIIIPNYQIKGMNVGKNTNRGMRNLAFYEFLQFLKHKSTEHRVKICLVDEHYTTVCCCSCGYQNVKPTNREYRCVSCGIETHRDANGAVNIFLKHVDQKQK